MRRIAFINESDKDSKALQAYKLIKMSLMQLGTNTDALVIIGTHICKDFDIDIEQAILKNKSFMEKYARIRQANGFSNSPIYLFNRLSSFDRWNVLYDILVETVLAPLMNLKNTTGVLAMA